MIRWWSNPEQAELVLKSVDDSDVINGVGTALLGYHGLAMSVLRPLSTRTLVDIQTVMDALDTVDLTPVSKALSEATRPVMGDASGYYGEILAEAFHDRAKNATERLLATWTNSGMPWPNAIERAAEVHGVPIERLGRYAHVMKATGVNPSVRADYADRALMEYASAVGNREAVVSNELIIKQRAVFNESEHPRNENGQFRDKTATEDKLAEVKRLRDLRDLRNLRDQRVVSERTSAQSQSQAKEKSIFEMLAERKSQSKVKTTAGAKFSNFSRTKLALFNKYAVTPSEDDVDKPVPANPNQERFDWTAKSYALIPKSKLDVLLAKGEFVAGNLQKVNGEKFSMVSGSMVLDELIDLLDIDDPTYDDDPLYLLVSDMTPIDLNHGHVAETDASGYGDMNKDTLEGEVLDNARFKVMWNQPELVEITNGLKGKKFSKIQWNAVHISLMNEEELSKSVVKNSDKVDDAQFNALHPRDAEGKFTAKQKQNAKLLELRALRDQRDLRDQKRAVQQKVVSSQAKEKSIFEMLAEKKNKAAVAPGAKFNNFASAKLATFDKYARKTDGDLPFSTWVGSFVPNEGLDVDINVKQQLSLLLTEHNPIPLAPNTDVGTGRDDSLMLAQLIRDADNRRPSGRAHTFTRDVGAGYVTEPILFPSAELALDYAQKQIDDGQWDYNYNYQQWQAQTNITDDGDFIAQVVPYDDRAYKIVVGAPSVMYKVVSPNPDVKPILRKLPQSTLKEFIEARDKQSDDVLDVSRMGFEDRITNPEVEVYEIIGVE